MGFSRLRPASYLLTGLLLACASTPDGDANGSRRETDGGRPTTATGGAGPNGGTHDEGGTAFTNPPSGSAGADHAGSAAGPRTSESGAAGNAPSAAGAAAGEAEQACLAGAVDACERCLCSQCTEQLQACAATEGCAQIALCTRESKCRGATCYCGTFDVVACAKGEANGPCKAAILEAPGSRMPTLVSPSAGPASDAAVAISVCAQTGQPCADACSSL